MQESSIDKAQRKILRISMIATVILIASVVWVNYERNIAVGDKTLEFKEEPMLNALNTIEAAYRSEVIVKGTELSDCLVTATFTDKTLEEVLLTLEYRYKFKLEKIDTRNYTVTGGKCNKE